MDYASQIIMSRPLLSVTIITLNEEKNLTRTLASVRWADEILVVDAGRTDRTVKIAEEFGAKVLSNPWPGYGKQKNFAQNHSSHDWVLNIDADEVVSDELRDEIRSRLEEIGHGRLTAQGFSFPRKAFYLGRWIHHGGWYPNYITRLANRRTAQWTEPSVHEELKVSGVVEKLEHPLHHYTFSSIEDQILTNLRYSKQGSLDLAIRHQNPSVLLLIFKPLGKFIESYFIKRGFLDGLPGFIIAVNAAHSMFLKYSFLFEVKIQKHESSNNR
jgi:glycosyltransferase involved in cell wall biosynthesis